MRLVGFVDARLFPTGFFGLCMAWELELLYGFGDWSFYGFGDWSFYGLPDVWSFYGFSDRRSFQSWLLWICLVTGASVDLMVGASVDLMECWIFSYRFFLSMHWRDEDRGLAGWLLDVQD